MNTTKLKAFAQQTRNKLKEQIAAKLYFILQEDSSELRGKQEVREQLNNYIRKLEDHEHKSTQQAKEQLVEEVAYTWFNRFIALRFMDVNNYHPFHVNVLTPIGESSTPEILDQVKAGIINQDIISKDKLMQILHLLDTTRKNGNPENEAYRIILVAVCNYLHRLLPFLFEGINDYTELLLPNDLTSPHSIITDVVEGMKEEDCQEVEILGWLYQYYVSEENERIISSRKKYTKEDLAPASQLFTPKWIVKYIVDNTLGRLWNEMKPETNITNSLEFYLKPQTPHIRKRKNLEEIKILDPCVGSAHILSYAFDVLYKMYEEEGYSNRDIPFLILKYNLWGVDIDPRAAQIAAFVLMMKGRSYYRRFLTKVAQEDAFPHVYYYKDFKFDDKFKNAKALGSVISVEPEEIEKIKREVNPLFKTEQVHLENLYQLLGQRYDVVVTNPPYISASRMEESVKRHVNSYYKPYAKDLFSVFVIRCLELCNENGLAGYMTPMVWMFIQSYQELRETLINKHTIDSLIQLAYDGFSGATVPICTFTLRKEHVKDFTGSYIRLSDFAGPAEQAPKTREAIQNPNCGWFYTANQASFKSIPGYNIGYWVSEKVLNLFSYKKINSSYITSNCIQPGNSMQFLRFWTEIDIKKIFIDWFFTSKGGEFRRWYGNKNFVIFFKDQGLRLSSHKSTILRGSDLYFSSGIVWTRVTSGLPSFRINSNNELVTDAGPILYSNNKKLLGFLNSVIVNILVEVLNPSLNLQVGNILNLPLLETDKEHLVQQNIAISKSEWDSRETSWEFKQNELIRQGKQRIQEAYQAYQAYWTEQFNTLHRNEETINQEFIAIYGLEEELTPDVPLDQITLLKDEAPIKNGKLAFNAKEVMKQLVSYGVGCLMGRYSLDKEGLILASQGETLTDYYAKIGKSADTVKLQPDADGIIPVLAEEGFEDDLSLQFEAFLGASFGVADLHDNLNFLQQCLGRASLREYFVKDFYADHIKRYQKRPIYWMLSSPKGAFRALIYLHRYTPDTLNEVLNNYLHPYIQKLENEIRIQEDYLPTTSGAERSRITKRIDELKNKLTDCEVYSKALYKCAVERIALDLDDGVLVNYNKLGSIVEEVKGLNDKEKKAAVRKFDWIEADEIR